MTLSHTYVLALVQTFMLFSDASQDSIDTVLSQVQQGEMTSMPVVLYSLSKFLSQTQKNYPAHNLELWQTAFHKLVFCFFFPFLIVVK